MKLQLPIRLVGSTGSPYTRKMVSLLRYRLIPYRITWGNPSSVLDQLEIEKPKPILHPTFLLKNEEGDLWAATDSTPIIRLLESEFMDRSVIPKNPVLAFLNYLIEDFGDEWGTKYMFHYRWHDKKDIDNAGTLLPLTSSTVISDETLFEMKKNFIERQVGRVWVVGSNKTTAPLIDASYDRFLTIMEKHLSQVPFMFGHRPASADFSFFGQLSQLIGFDPTPRSIAQKISMRTVAWVDKTEDLSGLEPSEDDWIKQHNIPDSINLLFREMGRTYVATMLKNEEAFKKGEEKWETEIDGYKWEQRTFPYQVKCLNWIREEYKRLSSIDKSNVEEILNGTGCERLLSK